MRNRISTLVIGWLLVCLMTPSWAVELPRTGQTSCYDAYGSSIACAGTGHDGATLAGVPLVNPRFTNHGNGTVTDNMTGLMWSQNANLPAGTKTWQQALDYVAGMNAGTYANFGYTDWRLPNVAELQSLVNHENSVTSLPTGHPFSNVQATSSSTYYYSSTTYPGYANPSSGVWLSNFYNGAVAIGVSKLGTRYVWPVRGGGGKVAIPRTGQTTSYATRDDGDLEAGAVWPSSRFINHGNNTITDRLTGLMWTQSSNVTSGNWQQALDYVAGMNNGSQTNFGYTDWRLPNVLDLRSLLNLKVYGPALPTSHPFANVTSGHHWSSTSMSGTPAKGWLVSLWAGYKTAENKSTSLKVWPVRSLLSMKLPLPSGKNWLLTVQAGGTVFCGGGTDTYHTGSGYYSLDFDDYSQQNGSESNVPIYAAASGTVDTSDYGYDASGYGHWVRVNHGNGYKTLYGHMTAQSLITSGAVNQGDQLGTIGNTGNSTGTHLHFQVSYNGSSASTVPELGLVLMEGLALNEYAVGCNAYYASTNTQ